MVSYGPWTQDPDYLQFQSVSESSGGGAFSYGTSTVLEETGYQDPAYEITVTNLEDAVDDSHAVIDGTSPLNLWGVSYSWGYEVSLPEGIKAVWGAGVARRICTVAAGGTYFYSPPNYGFTPPAGAIGIDYEGQPYDPGSPWAGAPGEIASRHLSALSNLGGHWFDDLTTGPDVVPDASTDVHLIPAGGSEAVLVTVLPPASATDTTNPAYRTLGASIDLAPYLYVGGAWIGGQVFTEANPQFAPPVNDPSSGSGLVMYGWGFETMRVDTMVTPPRYRWVFEGDPYRRIFPRDDGLGGGSPRTYPPSKSVQSGNRTSASYF